MQVVLARNFLEQIVGGEKMFYIDGHSPAIAAARKLLGRWPQENDFVDLLKVCARNARRQAEDLLRTHYLNRRDPVTLLRRMLGAGGRLRLDARGTLRVRLEPLNTPAENAVFERFIADINAHSPRTWGPAPYPIHFSLASRP